MPACSGSVTSWSAARSVLSTTSSWMVAPVLVTRKRTVPAGTLIRSSVTRMSSPTVAFTVVNESVVAIAGVVLSAFAGPPRPAVARAVIASRTLATRIDRVRWSFISLFLS